jgi:alpha-beta hydrolase superfamily lysophospholipase
METDEWNWKTRDGIKIYSKAWEPSGDSRGVVCLIHGLGEHIGRYQPDAEALVAGGYILAGFDQRGFGKSGGQRGHTPSLKAFFDDIDVFLKEVVRKYPDQPRFLYGHSMGGILVLGYTPVRVPAVKGIIATSPGLKSSVAEQKAKVFLSKILGKFVPTLTLDSGLDIQALSRGPMVAEVVQSDPLFHTKLTTACGKALMEAIDLAYQNAPRFPLPLLLMHGSKDEIAYPRGSILYTELAPTDKMTFKIWDGYKHELHTDTGKAEVFKMMLAWMDKVLDSE